MRGRDILVVSARVHLGSRGEDWLRQALGLAEALRQLNPADCSGGAIVLPTGSREVASHDALYGKHPRTPDDHAAAGDLLLERLVRNDPVGREALAKYQVREGRKQLGQLSRLRGENVVRDGVFEKL